MRRFLPFVVLALSACEPAPHPDTAAACALVERFEQALREGDRAGLADSITTDSRPAVDALGQTRLEGKPRMQVLGAAPHGDGILVRVLDPQSAGDSGFIVVREHGELRIDLIASAGLNAKERPLDGGSTRQVVRPLTPAQRAQAEAMAAQQAQGQPAQPPR